MPAEPIDNVANHVSGFLRPYVFNQEIISFFAVSNIGTIISNGFHPSLYPLNDALIFTCPGTEMEANIVYRKVSQRHMIKLFCIHSHYTNMRHQNGLYLSASLQMRQFLRQTMINTIQSTASKLINDHPHLTELINSRVPQLIANIDDIDNNNPEVGKIFIGDSVKQIFNPNHFPHYHFSSLISNARVEYADMDVDTYRVLTQEQDTMIKLAFQYKRRFGVPASA